MKFCSNCGGPVTYRVPKGDNRERAVCDTCDIVHYRNPLVVVGCVAERDGKVLMCRRAIEPRYGYWTLPAGFMELGETLAEGAGAVRMESMLVAAGSRELSLVSHPADKPAAVLLPVE